MLFAAEADHFLTPETVITQAVQLCAAVDALDATALVRSRNAFRSIWVQDKSVTPSKVLLRFGAETLEVTAQSNPRRLAVELGAIRSDTHPTTRRRRHDLPRNRP